MKSFKNILFLAIMGIIPLMSGCAQTTKITAVASGLVSGYCVAPVEERMILRKSVALAVHPNEIQIVCVGDKND